jgi:hypothetical protein
MTQRVIYVRYAESCGGTSVFHGDAFTFEVRECGALVILSRGEVMEAHAAGRWLSVDTDEEECE